MVIRASHAGHRATFVYTGDSLFVVVRKVFFLCLVIHLRHQHSWLKPCLIWSCILNLMRTVRIQSEALLFKIFLELYVWYAFEEKKPLEIVPTVYIQFLCDKL